MANLNEVFTLDSLPTNSTGSFDPIPVGWYTASVVDALLKDSKSGGQYINVRYDILGPTNAGRVIYGMITIRNASSKAEEIGRMQLADLMRAIGLVAIGDTDELIGGKCQIKVEIQESEGYGAQNRVVGFKAMANAGSAAKASDTTAAPPWKKK